MITTIDDIKKIRSSRKSALRGVRSVGFSGMWSRCKKELDGITKKQFVSILEAMVDEIKARLLSGKVVNLPSRMGQLCIKEAFNKAWIDKEGRVRSSYPVDWKATLTLWIEDADAKAAKTKIYNLKKKSSLYITYNRNDAKWLINRDVRFKRLRKLVLEAEQYAEKHPEVHYFIKKRYNER
jgi:hypothetical protein